MLGIKDFTLDISEKEFEAGSEDDQGKLDTKSLKKCPECGYEF